MSFGPISKNIFGVKASVGSGGGGGISLTGTTEAAASNANISVVAEFVSLTDFLPVNIRSLVNLALVNFIGPFDDRLFFKIGSNEMRLQIMTGIANYSADVSNDDTLVTFLSCISKAVNAAYNMKSLETTFITYKQDAKLEIDNLKREINVLLGQGTVFTGAATGLGTASFGIELGNFYAVYIYIYGYKPDEDNWITELRTSIVQRLLAGIDNGDITINDILPELYINT